MPAVLFYLMAATAVLAAFLMICSRNAVYSALYLIGTLCSLAVIFLLLHAEFLAAIQILVYAGAIMVLFLFVIMLLNLGIEERVPIRLKGQKAVGALLSLGFLGTLFLLFQGATAPPPTGPYSPEALARLGNTQAIGRLLFTDYLLPFEVTSLLLFVAIVGAVVLARKRP